jgi:hypothetical protein
MCKFTVKTPDFSDSEVPKWDRRPLGFGLENFAAWDCRQLSLGLYVAWIVAFPQSCDMKVKTLSIGGKRQSDQTPSAGFVLTDVLYDLHASDSRLSVPNGC